MDSIISQTKLSKISGTSRQAVYKAIRAGHIVLDKNRKVIFDNDQTQLWYQKQIAKNPNTPIQKPQGKIIPEPKQKGGLVGLQIEKINEEIGKIRADKRLKELQYAQKRESLVEKETFGAVLFQYLDALNINMLEMPDMIIDTVMDKISSGASRGDIIKLMRDAIQKSIINTKKQIKDRLT